MRRVLFLDFYCSLVPFLSEYTKNKLKFQSKALKKKLSWTSNEFFHNIFIAAKNGQIICVFYFFLLENHVNLALSGAALSGYIKLCEKLIEHGADDLNWALGYAAKGGHVKVIKKMIELGADHYSWGFTRSAIGGHMKIAEKLISKIGKIDLNWAFENAVYEGHFDMCEWLIKIGNIDFTRAVTYARDEKMKEYLKNLA